MARVVAPVLVLVVLFTTSSVAAQREDVLWARRDRAEADIVRLEASILTEPHEDDTAAAWLTGIGTGTFVLGVAGVLFAELACADRIGYVAPSLYGGGTSEGECRRQLVSRDMSYAMIGVGSVGLVSMVVGIVWLSSNGQRFRQLEGARERVRRIDERLSYGASIDGTSATFFVSGSF